MKRKTDEWDVTGPKTWRVQEVKNSTATSQTQTVFKPSGRIKQDVGMESKDEELIIALKDLPGLRGSQVFSRLAKLQAREADGGFWQILKCHTLFFVHQYTVDCFTSSSHFHSRKNDYF